MLSFFASLVLLSGNPVVGSSLNIPPSASDIEQDAIRHCTSLSKEPNPKIDYCVRLAKDGAKQWIDVVSSRQASVTVQNALARCRSDYSKDGKADWMSIGVCAQMQDLGPRQPAYY